MPDDAPPAGAGVTTTETATTTVTTDDAKLHARQSAYIMGTIAFCAMAIAAVTCASFVFPAQDWQLAKDGLIALGAIASSLSTGYFALQKGNRS